MYSVIESRLKSYSTGGKKMKEKDNNRSWFSRHKKLVIIGSTVIAVSAQQSRALNDRSET